VEVADDAHNLVGRVDTVVAVTRVPHSRLELHLEVVEILDAELADKRLVDHAEVLREVVDAVVEHATFLQLDAEELHRLGVDPADIDLVLPVVDLMLRLVTDEHRVVAIALDVGTGIQALFDDVALAFRFGKICLKFFSVSPMLHVASRL